MRKLLCIAATMLVAACASVVAESPSQRVFALEADYASLLSAAETYESLPRCAPGDSTIACSDVHAVERIRQADNVAAAALDAAEATVRDPVVTEGGVEAALTAAANALGALETILTELGVA